MLNKWAILHKKNGLKVIDFNHSLFSFSRGINNKTFCVGLTELQCDSISKIQNKLEHLRNLLNDPHEFKGIYRYAYDFARVRYLFS